MNGHAVNDLRGFYQFVGDKVRKGVASATPEDLLDEWRSLHPDPKISQEDIEAIQEVLDDMNNGDAGILFDEFDKDFRNRHNIPAKS